jgi:Zn-dependent M28 family amino/carboxypeptidase
MLELARGISQWAHGFKNGVIFLFNTGEEEGLSGAHSFITQVCSFIDAFANLPSFVLSTCCSFSLLQILKMYVMFLMFCFYFNFC